MDIKTNLDYDMENKVEVLCHSSIKITGSKIIYIDPFRINKIYKDADYIFCTHSHYDHFSPEDIKKVITEKTILITVESSKEEALKLVSEDRLKIVEPNKSYTINDLNFETTYAYNKDKQFHPKGNRWVGYNITMDRTRYYIAGDTDDIPEIENIEADIAFIPIGGTYTMDYKEAANLANKINAKTIIPTHYGSIVGKMQDANKFSNLVKDKKVEIKIK